MPSNIIPNMIEKGIYKDEKHNIAWMVKKRIKGQTLTEHLKSGFDIDKKAILYQYLRIVKTTEMISKIFRCSAMMKPSLLPFSAGHIKTSLRYVKLFFNTFFVTFGSYRAMINKNAGGVPLMKKHIVCFGDL